MLWKQQADEDRGHALPQEGRAALVRVFQAQLAEWAPILQRFLKNEDDQVRGA